MVAKTDNKVRVVKVREVEREAARLRKAREATRAARDSVDKTILSARKAKATYRELAEAAGVSTAWVQTSLERSGYKTKPR